jgi:predicted TIM-barrel fold metal-dependent hydrolase
MSFDPSEKVNFTAPEFSCDSHFHVFGPAEQYSYGSDLRYKPPHAPLDEYLKLANHLGITRFVFVQPSAYARDNNCMLEAMRQIGIDRCRGVVDIDENAPDSLLASMNDVGVRAVRINVSPVFPNTPGLAQKMLPRINLLAKRCKEIGWHLDFLLPGWLTLELLPVLHRLELPFSIAHMGMNLAKDGVNSEGFRGFLELVKDPNHLAYAKFTGIYRMSKTPGFTDADPLAMTLIDKAPKQIIWGSDYPHLSFGEESSVELFNLLARWTDDASIRKLILVDNPAKLFGF